MSVPEPFETEIDFSHEDTPEYLAYLNATAGMVAKPKQPKQLPALRALPTIKPQWSEEEMQLIRDVIAPEATEAQIKLFLYDCARRGMDPLQKDMYLILRKSRQKDGSQKIIATHQTSIDGFRKIAGRSGKLSGIQRGIRIDEKGMIYAWARVYRSDWEIPAEEELSLAEYRGTTGCWQTMPQTMLRKCAEAAALRMAFPEDLGNLYINEEMDQADRRNPVAEVTKIENIKECKKIIERIEKPEDSPRKKRCREIYVEIHNMVLNGLLTTAEIHIITGETNFVGLGKNECLEEMEVALKKIQSFVQSAPAPKETIVNVEIGA